MGELANPAQRRWIAGVLILGAAVALAAMWWAGQRRMAVDTPITLSQAAGGTVWVSSHGHLHELDAHGGRLRRVGVQALGLPHPVLHLHAVGRDEVLVAAGEPTRVHRCHVGEVRCRAADAGYIERFGRFKNTVWMAANADGSRIVLSDNAAHRLALLDGQGRLLASAGDGIGRFHYPGQPVWMPDGTVWLASSDHHRVERIDVAADRIGEPLQAVRLRGAAPPLKGRTWPMALAPVDDGALWVLVKHNMMTRGGLVRMQADGGFDAEASLPASADASAVTRLGDALVVADLGSRALLRMTLDGKDARPFGDPAIRAELRQHAAEVERWEWYQQLAMWTMIGLPIVGIGVLLLLGERMPVQGGFDRPSVPPDVPAAYGAPIGITPRMRRQITLLMTLAAVATIAMGALLVLGMPGPTGLRRVALLGGFSAAALATGGALWWTTRILLSQRLRVIGSQVQYERGGLEVARAAFADCFTDGRRLMIGGRRVVLFAREPMFERAAVESQILAHIPRANWLSGAQLEWRSLRGTWREHPWRVIGLVLLFGVTALATLLPDETIRPLVQWFAVR
jgi:hypothetical protein